MKIYGFPSGYRTTACAMAFEAVGADYTIEILDYAGLKSEKMLKMNPLGKSPILETPEGPVFETIAIVRHASRVSGKFGGADAFENALIDQWLSWCNSEFSALFEGFLYQIWGVDYPGLSFKPEDVNRARELFIQKLGIINDALSGKKFLVGNSYTIADVCIASYIYTPLAFCLSEKERNQIKHVINWITGISQQAWFKRFFGRLRFCAQPLKVVAPPAPAPAQKPAKKEAQKKEDKPKQEKAAKKEDDDEEYREPKPKDPVFPPTELNLMTFKTEFINEPDHEKALANFWSQYKAGEWSLWHLKYIKYPGECEIIYRTNNLLRTFMSRLENVRRYIFGTHFVLGDEPVLFIEGVWLMRGPELLDLIKEIDVWDTYEWIKLDGSLPETQALVKDFWCHRKEDEQQVQGKIIRTFKWIK